MLNYTRALALAREPIPQSAAIALLAMLLAWTIWSWLPPLLTGLERSPYDAWLRLRDTSTVSPAIIVIARDATSETRFGAGVWDRALLARMITALDHAGAAVIMADIPVVTPSPVGLGGPASDAMLAEITKSAANVIVPLPARFLEETTQHEQDSETSALAGFVHPAWVAAESDRPGALPATLGIAGPLPLTALNALNAGHTLAPADPDGVVRSVPLFVTVRGRRMPAFALAAASAYLHVTPDRIRLMPDRAVILQEAHLQNGKIHDATIPTGEGSRMFIRYASPHRPGTFPTYSFVTVWDAIESGEPDKLRSLVGGKLVALLPGTSEGTHRTPLGLHVPDAAIQLDLLNTLLVGNWIAEPPGGIRLLIAGLLGGLAGWSLMRFPGWTGVAAVVALALGYSAAVLLTLTQGGLVLPLFVPLCALMFSTGGGVLSAHLTAKYRMRQLEGDILKVNEELAAVRQALVCQESTVEALEEDLEAARAQAARSVGQQAELVRTADALHSQLADAHVSEEATRRRIEELEQQLNGLRAVSRPAVHLGAVELERLREECEQMGILTCDPQVLAVFRDLKRAARASLPVLILGEPGTGKELFARAVHRLSPRASHPFMAINMAAISPELFESELFGHVKGSFTGAMADRQGYFELAHRGTIFLDEIGDLPLIHQGKLLRVLQDKTFYRVGATHSTTVDVRVVAATNKDLARGVGEGWFREDLYFRLTGIILRLPPLRERRSDLALLAERFVRDAARASREGMALTEEALAALRSQPWPGNVRELQHCLEQAVVLAEGPVITASDLRLQSGDGARPLAHRGIGRLEEALVFDPASDQAVLDCLRRHEFDMRATAIALGCDRSTVTQRLKGLGFRALVDSGGDHGKAALILAGDPALERAVELKLLDYSRHLYQLVERLPSAEAATAACRKRFKNLPDRHFRAVETLLRRHFENLPNRSPLPHS